MSKQIRKSRYGKNLRIGVRFNGDKFVLLNGSPLPKLRTNAVGELLLQADVIENSADRDRFTRDDVVRMLERGSRHRVLAEPARKEPAHGPGYSGFGAQPILSAPLLQNSK